ncbi:LTA synthase family protein [Clostridium ljungdahlii]|uniref:Lipoteichoic acid synthase 2 n=2 Tax=Clostridium ljungdahlii TaxID=1538 RepID=D8GPN6_CLOLD|nr:LTA synthase family protein [Clostridium ljungdahlii]ADK13945.1 predicted alkaline phosphatase superfamily enzyme [Clostridium ljungdahlii DSM 13528]OAA87436.1 Lipoteichoic acid synthase 2 [Clostridium ljungdahlii DSM 13528]
MDKIKSFFTNFIDVIFFVTVVMFKILVYGKHMSSFKSSFIPALASVFVLVSIACIFKTRGRARFLYICNCIISIFIVSDLIYYKYFKDIISVSVLISGFQLNAVKSSVANLLDFKDFLYLFDIVFIIPFINRYLTSQNRKLSTKVRVSMFLVFILVGIFIDFKSFYALSKEQPRLLTTMYNKVYIAKKLGTVNYHCLDIYNCVFANINRLTPVSKDKFQAIEYFIDKSKSSHENLNGIGQGKNLIMIQVEALQGFVINSSVNGKEITPNLNRWISRSEYFDNFYYQVAAGGTSDAEFMTNNSLYPASAGAAYLLYSGNEYNAMPKNFKNKGYYTAALHGFRESFWNRNVMYRKFGFDNFYGEKSYKQNESIGLGLSDKSFLTQSVEKLKNMKSPYYAFLITLTSHFPYDDVNKYGDFDVGDYKGSLIGNYMKAIHYTDEQLGMFLDELDKNGTLKNSIVVLYGDHYAIPKDKQDQLFNFLKTGSKSDLEWEKLQKVPMFIHFPDESVKGVNHVYGGQMDIYPTVCNLFKLKEEDMLGKDLFNPESERVTFRNGSFIDKDCYYSSQDDIYYDVNTGNKISKSDKLEKEEDYILNQLGYSDYILRHNLIKKLNLDKNK